MSVNAHKLRGTAWRLAALAWWISILAGVTPFAHATPPSISVPSSLQHDETFAYAAWGGLVPEGRTTPDVVVLSAIDIDTGEVAWSLKGAGRLAPLRPYGFEPRDEIPQIENRLFLNGTIGTRWGAYAIDTREGRVVLWVEGATSLAVGVGVVVTTGSPLKPDGAVLDAMTGRRLWTHAPCRIFVSV